ncbi:hypothetical protein ADUPG1_006502 [Aduncisulcus paluster]|uniref:Uncharacterized protein n=1 Tax=Aduncisulcus paluster TaxID=2918883 RepID=A0ABQ5KIG7_9EUKA|nr:hypothetical protein ADUPG1_006502 [Aduncisulcus paluster]|eukprot:gnl/Carplike_NY0171/5548_a7596_256.p1 GENE.gnl/Carplike_NY0171/5548_a7596_256~~gnl/Carplike_NY0171/5548_a7596_256.p1  ORF type:complete len:227 (+),score=38.95 gnl/Carplike_NY0171/5548_a7596_256:76-756(+)
MSHTMREIADSLSTTPGEHGIMSDLHKLSTISDVSASTFQQAMGISSNITKGPASKSTSVLNSAREEEPPDLLSSRPRASSTLHLGELEPKQTTSITDTMRSELQTTKDSLDRLSQLKGIRGLKTSYAPATFIEQSAVSHSDSSPAMGERASSFQMLSSLEMKQSSSMRSSILKRKMSETKKMMVEEANLAFNKSYRKIKRQIDSILAWKDPELENIQNEIEKALK